jgi:hypothetical protein
VILLWPGREGAAAGWFRGGHAATDRAGDQPECQRPRCLDMSRQHSVFTGLDVNWAAIRWSCAANLPIRSCRFSVGCPQDRGERGRRIHLRVRQQPQFFELVRLQEVGLIADDHDAAVPLGGLLGTERADDRDLKAAVISSPFSGCLRRS